MLSPKILSTPDISVILAWAGIILQAEFPLTFLDLPLSFNNWNFFLCILWFSSVDDKAFCCISEFKIKHGKFMGEQPSTIRPFRKLDGQSILKSANVVRNWLVADCYFEDPSIWLITYANKQHFSTSIVEVA